MSPLAGQSWIRWPVQHRDDAESGGAVQIGAIQFAIIAGAGVGGVFFDHVGVTGVLLTSSVVTLVAAAMAMIAFRGRTYPLACRRMWLEMLIFADSAFGAVYVQFQGI